MLGHVSRITFHVSRPNLVSSVDAPAPPSKMPFRNHGTIMAANENRVNITSVSTEHRVFPPPKDFSKTAHLKSLAQYRKLYNESIRSPEKFWAKQAKNELVWFKPWTKVLQWKEPFAKWFLGGRLNVSYNCLDRHLGTPTANKAALIWEGEPASPGKPGEERTLTYKQLHREVCLFANVLKRNGIKKGDRVLIYLPMVPEAAIAMLACARIGAVHSVVFGGFSAQSVADRIFDSQAKAGHHGGRRLSPGRGRAAETECG
jgi:acetyl-CoA synthetase